MKRGARFSRCGQYRYALTREWDPAGSTCAFIGLNPSTADAYRDDPTIRRCIGFAKNWGHGKLLVVNLFAFRATYPADLKAAADPVGPRNNYWLRRLLKDCDIAIAAWGNDGGLGDRDHYLRKLGIELHSLGVTKEHQPRHPLYARGNLLPKIFS